MITRASELLALFIEAEKKKVAAVDMPHMPTLGSAYEEITKQGIDKDFVIPKVLDLRMVSGFIEVDGAILPQQIDCMLVHGNGTQYGGTSQFIYSLDDVLCIFEVKKTLSRADLADAIDHLAAVRRKFSEVLERRLQDPTFSIAIGHARKTFAQITGTIAPESLAEIFRLPPRESVLLYTLIQEQHAPVTIVHGYGGYKTEAGLRRAFVETLEDRLNAKKQGLGVPSLPTLIIADQFCLVKAAGNPYLAIRNDHSWVAVASTRHNQALVMLEVIWAKIASRFGAAMPYGRDLRLETVAPLLVAEVQQSGTDFGWVFHSLEYKEGSLRRDEHKDWHPERVGAAELSALNTMMFRGGQLPVDDPELGQYLATKHKTPLSAVVRNLVQTRLFALQNGFVVPVSTVTHVLPDDDESGAYVAIDRNRFDEWCGEHGVAPYYINLLMM